MLPGSSTHYNNSRRAIRSRWIRSSERQNWSAATTPGCQHGSGRRDERGRTPVYAGPGSGNQNDGRCSNRSSQVEAEATMKQLAARAGIAEIVLLTGALSAQNPIRDSAIGSVASSVQTELA